jgi:hypothetical protein
MKKIILIFFQIFMKYRLERNSKKRLKPVQFNCSILQFVDLNQARSEFYFELDYFLLKRHHFMFKIFFKKN